MARSPIRRPIRDSAMADPPPKGYVGKVVAFAVVLFALALTWRIYQTTQAKGLAERLRKTDANSIARLAADARSSSGFAKSIEKAAEKSSNRKTALAAIALGATNDEAWAKEIIDRQLGEGSPVAKLDLAEVLRPSPSRSAERDLAVLMRLVKDSDAGVRQAAAGSMLMYGVAARNAVAKVLQEGPNDVLVDALGASVVKGDAVHVAAFAAATSSANPAVRERAMLSLGNASPTEKPPPFLSAIEKGIADPVESVSKAAVRALVRLGPAAISPLESTLNSKQRKRREAAVEALAEAPALAVRLASTVVKRAIGDEVDLANKFAQLLLGVPPTIDLVNAFKAAARDGAKEKARLRSVLSALIANENYPPAKEVDCAEMGPVFEVWLDLPCDVGCMARARKEEHAALQKHECWEEAYRPLLINLGQTGSDDRKNMAAILRGEKPAFGGKKGGKKR